MQCSSSLYIMHAAHTLVFLFSYARFFHMPQRPPLQAAALSGREAHAAKEAAKQQLAALAEELAAGRARRGRVLAEMREKVRVGWWMRGVWVRGRVYRGRGAGGCSHHARTYNLASLPQQGSSA